MLPPGWMPTLGRVARATGSQVVLEGNLAAGHPEATAVLLREARRAIPPNLLAGIAIGNEPDLYPVNHWYRDARNRLRGVRRVLILNKSPDAEARVRLRADGATRALGTWLTSIRHAAPALNGRHYLPWVRDLRLDLPDRRPLILREGEATIAVPRMSGVLFVLPGERPERSLRGRAGRSARR